MKTKNRIKVATFLEPEVKQRLEKVADLNYTSMSKIINSLVLEYLAKIEEEQ